MRRSRLHTTQYNIPVSNVVLLNSVDSLHSSFKVIAVELEASLYCFINIVLHLIIKLQWRIQ